MERSIETEIEIEASPERVWRAWTEPDEFGAWWGEEGKYRVTKWAGDLKPGGKWRSEGVCADGSSFWVEGEFLIVEKPSKLSFTWQHDWEKALTKTVVTLWFEPTGSGTLLKLLHSGFDSDESRDSHEMGWAQVLGWLRKHVEPITAP